MKERENIRIHETAFITSTFRSLNEDLSKDYYAKLWCNKKTNKWVDDYLKNVSSEEVYTHCLRNRYFLDKITKLVDENEVEVLINFGCGFSMYPFLLNKSLIHIEIDKPEIIEYKKSKTDLWQKTSILPKRNIYFIGVDFSDNYEEKLISEIKLIKNTKKCFILIEGVLFFLNIKQTNRLFSLFEAIQYQGDFIGSASFQKLLEESLVFKKLLTFINEKMFKVKDYLTIPDKFYKSKQGYNLIDHQDYFSLSEKYSNQIHLENELILNENFYLLKKI